MKENKNTETFKAENKKTIQSHKATSLHLEIAAKHHQEAIKHHEAGNHDKVTQSTITAHGRTALANEIQKGKTKRYANNTPKT